MTKQIWWIQATVTSNMVFVASPLSMQRSREKADGLARNQHVFKWSDKYIYRLLREDYKDPAKPIGLVQNIQLSPLVYYKTDIISSNATCYRLKISHFALNNNSL